jgi:flagellin-like hook-associated protein FlgL
MWYLNDDKDRDEIKTEIEKTKEHLAEIKQTLEIDDWLNGCQTIKDFISSLE